jgi:hypothetical protein
MEAVRTSETSVDNHFTRQYNPEDSSEHHTRRRENLKSHKAYISYYFKCKSNIYQYDYTKSNSIVVNLVMYFDFVFPLCVLKEKLIPLISILVVPLTLFRMPC